MAGMQVLQPLAKPHYLLHVSCLHAPVCSVGALSQIRCRLTHSEAIRAFAFHINPEVMTVQPQQLLAGTHLPRRDPTEEGRWPERDHV
eukprot:CAMPEP_0181251288 /NCGR_PEP_ID=MMETSP1096-20121128/46799_1 /TAXON_ID=156174 ORGANISM="Chrysochromulina ericina, Strain CCMP281" /NCGR_SAMPLE_ID=MMETSP1096 /ASSEMBLY_ACC=CAM_ASM_000453 /LENGTH=87 /DNA_ID=CAMNT_0023348865 /DNA_START=225 /DNA_END=485 /DNA_ORIENTATION=+